MSLRSLLDAAFGSAWHVNHGGIMDTLLPATDGAIEANKPITTDANKAVSGLGGATSTGAIGYEAGAGGTVTQATNRSTGVTLNKLTGQITMNGASLAAAAHADFVVTNSEVGANDVVIANIVPGGTGSPRVDVVDVAAGAFTLRVTNDHASTADTSADKINFAVLKGVAA